MLGRTMSQVVVRPLCVAGLLLALFVPEAPADIVHLKSGQKVEGKVVSEGATTIEVDTKFGRMSLERAKVDRIERQRLPQDEVTHRRREAGQDVAALYAVALYAKEHRLTNDYRSILQDILKLDALHTEANKGLGRVFYEGQWFTPEELEKYKSRFADQMKAEGKVLYKGSWVTEETAKRLEGYELYQGQWLRWKEIYTLQAQENMPLLLGVTLEIRDSEHFTLRSSLGEDAQKDVLDLAEEEHTHFFSVFKPDETEAYIMDFYPIAIYVLPEVALVGKFVEPDGYMKKLYNPPIDIESRYVDANSFPLFFPRPLIVTSEGRHLKGGESRIDSLHGFIAHYLGNVLVRRFKRGGALPGWVEAGVAHYYEGLMNGYRTLSITEYVGYEQIEKWDITLQNFLQWYKKVADPDFRRTLPALAEIRPKIVEELNAFDLVKGYFVVYWLMETKPQQFVDYVRAAFREKPESRIRITEEEAFTTSFQVSCEELEAEWEEWVAQIPPRPPL